ncbi:hypothetical protein EPO17_00845 [Patescibacteria group bacterium]|nr:MAG: hypothetical protein EPO17_00845 [Patescibacteria group bacterium]
MSQNVSPAEEQQLLQTIEMFEIITKTQPLDYESLEILRQAYMKLGRNEDELRTLRRLVQARQALVDVQMKKAVQAVIAQCQAALDRFPDDPELKAISEKLLVLSAQ